MDKGLRRGLVMVLSCVMLMGGSLLYAEPQEEAEKRSLSVEEQMRQMGYSEEAIRAYKKEEVKLPPTWPWSPSFPTREQKKEVVASSWIMTALLGGLTVYFAVEHNDVYPKPAAFAGGVTAISATVATIYTFKPVRERSALLNLEKGRVVMGVPSSHIKEKEYHLSLLKIRF